MTQPKNEEEIKYWQMCEDIKIMLENKKVLLRLQTRSCIAKSVCKSKHPLKENS